MKTQKLVILIALIATVIALASGSTYAYYAITYPSNSTPTTPMYGAHGFYQNDSEGNYQNWSGTAHASMMGSGMRRVMPTPQTQTPAPQNTNTYQSSVVPLAGFGYLAIIAGAVAGTGSLGYLATYRKTASIKQQLALARPITYAVSENFSQKQNTSYASVAKTLNSEERQVLNILAAHNGKYLQKYIRSETGFSRLKTHRIVTRLSQRGIVTLEKTGNTNQVVLSDWLQDSSTQTSA